MGQNRGWVKRALGPFRLAPDARRNSPLRRLSGRIASQIGRLRRVLTRGKIAALGYLNGTHGTCRTLPERALPDGRHIRIKGLG